MFFYHTIFDLDINRQIFRIGMYATQQALALIRRAPKWVAKVRSLLSRTRDYVTAS